MSPNASIRLILCLLAVGGLSAACGGGNGDDPPPPPPAPTDAGGDDAGPMDNGVAYDETFTGTCAGSVRCEDSETESACACVATPRSEAVFETNRVGCGQLEASGETVRTPEDDFCDDGANDGAADLGCFMPGMYREAAAEETFTMYGVVDVFGNGGDADQITITVHRENPDGTVGEMLGSAVASTDDPCFEQEDEIDNDMVIGTRDLGFYYIEGLPSDTPLVVHQSGNRDFWRDIYSFNIYAPADELERGAPPGDACATFSDAALATGPRWEFRARILSTSDWLSIPLTAGLVEGVRSGSGVVAGEIHDCNDIRLEYAQVATTPTAQVLTYFNDNPDNPLPSTGRTEGTSLLSLFAALDIPEGPVNVAALGRVDGQVVSLGWYKAEVIAGAVSTITMRGLRPQQTVTE